MGLNGGNQSVAIDLPGPLHSGSSVITDEHPYIKTDIPSPTPQGAGLCKPAIRQSACYSSCCNAQDSMETQGHPDG